MHSMIHSRGRSFRDGGFSETRRIAAQWTRDSGICHCRAQWASRDQAI